MLDEQQRTTDGKNILAKFALNVENERGGEDKGMDKPDTDERDKESNGKDGVFRGARHPLL